MRLRRIHNLSMKILVEILPVWGTRALRTDAKILGVVWRMG